MEDRHGKITAVVSAVSRGRLLLTDMAERVSNTTDLLCMPLIHVRVKEWIATNMPADAPVRKKDKWHYAMVTGTVAAPSENGQMGERGELQSFRKNF
jgi:hypothetical protein